MAKNVVLTPKAIQWGREHGYGQLMNDLEAFVPTYQASWRTSLKVRSLEKVIAAHQKALDQARTEMEEALAPKRS